MAGIDLSALKVPTYDGFTLAESQAILDHLEEAFPQMPRLLPANIQERARARMILGWSDLLALRHPHHDRT